MKKLFILFVLFMMPAIADAAPSVRMLGGSQNTGSNVKITPMKTSQAALTNVANTSRAGTLRMKTGGSAGAISSSSARFPVITSAKVYNNVTTPTSPSNTSGGTSGSGGGSGSGTGVSGDVDVNAIVNAVVNTVRNEYYNRNETYTQQEINQRFEDVNNSITNINQTLDDDRFDTISIGDPRTRSVNPRGPAPAGYVYIWIEE